MLLNTKEQTMLPKVRVGFSKIDEVRIAKLLGMKQDNDQNWTSISEEKIDYYNHSTRYFSHSKEAQITSQKTNKNP